MLNEAFLGPTVWGCQGDKTCNIDQQQKEKTGELTPKCNRPEFMDVRTFKIEPFLVNKGDKFDNSRFDNFSKKVGLHRLKKYQKLLLY